MSFDEAAWDVIRLNQLFMNTSESMKEINALFDKPRGASTNVKKMVKLEDLVKFVVPCTI